MLNTGDRMDVRRGSVKLAACVTCAFLLAACNAGRPSPHTSTVGDVPAPRSVMPEVPPVHLAQCTGPATSLPDSLARLPSRAFHAIPDERWAKLARTVPGGFAGTFYDSTHTPILMLTNPALAAEAKESLASSMPGFQIGMATVRQARWDFAQLVDWFNYLLPRVAVGPMVADKDESINRIRFGVTSIAARDSVVRALSALPLPCDLVVVDLSGFVVKLMEQ